MQCDHHGQQNIDSSHCIKGPYTLCIMDSKIQEPIQSQQQPYFGQENELFRIEITIQEICLKR